MFIGGSPRRTIDTIAGARGTKGTSLMTMRFRLPLQPLAAGSAIAFALIPAAAMGQDAADFAQKFAAAYAYSGYEIVFGPGTAEGDTLRFDGVTVQIAGMGELFGPTEIEGPVVVEGVVAEPDGGYRAERLLLPDIALAEDGFSLTIAGSVFEGLDVPAGPEIRAEDALRLFAGAGTGAIGLTLFEGPPVTIASSRADIAITEAEDGPVFNSTSSITGFSVDLAAMEGMEMEAGLAVLGITTLTGSMTQKATWSLGSGRMEIPETAITLDKLGTFNLSATLLGYTADVLDALAESQIELAGLTDPEARTAAELAIGEQTLGALSLEHVGLSFSELGLIKALIQFAADAQGISYDEAVEGLAVQLPVLLMSGGDLTTAARAAEAASAFVNDPRQLELRADFEPPFAFSTLVEEEAAEEPPEGMAVTLTANGIGPIPIDLEDMPLEALLDGMMELEDMPGTDAPDTSSSGPRTLPPPGADPRQ